MFGNQPLLPTIFISPHQLRVSRLVGRYALVYNGCSMRTASVVTSKLQPEGGEPTLLGLGYLTTVVAIMGVDLSYIRYIQCAVRIASHDSSTKLGSVYDVFVVPLRKSLQSQLDLSFYPIGFD